MDRKEFLKRVGTVSVGAGLCSLATSLHELRAAGEKAAAPSHPCEEKVKFAEEWIGRFMGALDENLDEGARAKVMRAASALSSRRSRPASRARTATARSATWRSSSARPSANPSRWSWWTPS